MDAKALSFLCMAALCLLAVTAFDIQPLIANISSASQVYYPTDANWTATVQRWSTWYEPTFSVGIKPGTTADLQTIVRPK